MDKSLQVSFGEEDGSGQPSTETFTRSEEYTRAGSHTARALLELIASLKDHTLIVPMDMHDASP